MAATTGAHHLYVHVSLADLATHLGGDPAVGEVEKLGPATLDLIRSWLNDSKATIQPVLDLNRCDAVDQHDPPPRMREQVILRDRHCVFPWCGRDARARTSTTPSRTSHPTKADHPARPIHRTWRRCAGDTTAPRPSPAGPTTAPATAPTLDQPPRTHLERRTRRDPRARARPNPTPLAGPRRTPSPPDPADPADPRDLADAHQGLRRRAPYPDHSCSSMANTNSLPQAPLKNTFSWKCASRRMPTRSSSAAAGRLSASVTAIVRCSPSVPKA